jgi:fructose-bisphosphate aldolase/6-deoxy-5-ketofructose 1-phosphate synthase
MVEKQTIQVPADVPKEKEAEYIKNIELVTHGLRRMMLFAGDQKIEHLNDDFGSTDASPEDADPEHMFKIASKARISCFATQLGLLSKYGRDYSTVPYIVKLNSKTNIVPVEDKDPLSEEMVTPEEVIQFKQSSGLNIVGMGHTLYLGSEYEPQMLKEASEAILKAHQNGMFFILWVYPRGKNVPDPYAPHIIAGATGVAVSIGADFVKVTYPKLIDTNDPIVLAEKFKEAVSAAGRTMVIVSGGSKMEVPEFLQQLHNQIHISGAAGNATGRNVHMRPLEEAIRLCNAISAIVFDDATPDEAINIYENKNA